MFSQISETINTGHEREVDDRTETETPSSSKIGAKTLLYGR